MAGRRACVRTRAARASAPQRRAAARAATQSRSLSSSSGALPALPAASTSAPASADLPVVAGQAPPCIALQTALTPIVLWITRTALSLRQGKEGIPRAKGSSRGPGLCLCNPLLSMFCNCSKRQCGSCGEECGEEKHDKGGSGAAAAPCLLGVADSHLTLARTLKHYLMDSHLIILCSNLCYHLYLVR